MLSAALLVGCSTSTARRQDDQVVLAGRRLRVVLEPEHRRMVWLSVDDGPNLLWTNQGPALLDQPAGRFVNRGGDKAWLWPQSQWTGKPAGWPPPGDVVGQDHQAIIRGSAVWTRSNQSVRGVWIERRFSIDRSDRLRVITRLPRDPLSPQEPLEPWLPWQVTQVPRPDRLFVRLLREDDPLQQPVGKDVPLTILGRNGRIIELEPVTDTGRKSFFDADRLAVLLGRTLVIATQVSDRSARFPSGVRAQVYADAKVSNFRGEAPPYVELEFVGPLPGPTKPEATELQVLIEVHPLDAIDDSAIHRLLLN